MTKKSSIEKPDYSSPKSIMSFLEQKGLSPLKKFGQNFMINPYAKSKIISDLSLLENDTVWEIGAGLGVMTEEILKTKAKKLSSFEIDKGFISLLKSFFIDEIEKKRFSIIEGDVLKNWEGEIEKEGKPTCVFGNLPYNIAATFIGDTISRGIIFEKCVFTVQKEVAERMTSKEGSENYSSFTVICKECYNVEGGLVLSPKSFWPHPSVFSQEVIMTKREGVKSENLSFFVKVVHTLFSARRKTIKNNIKGLLPTGVTSDFFFEQCGIKGERRSETLSVQEFEKICEMLMKISSM